MVVLTIMGIAAQDNSSPKSEAKFGIKAGYSSTTLRVSFEGNSVSDNISGFYLGAFGEFYLSEKIDLQPELHYANYSQDGESSAVLLVPVLFKYKANEKFSLLAGPQLDYLLNEEDAEGLNQLGFGVALGAAFDITENVIIDARYSFGLSNRIGGDLAELEGMDITAKFNYFQVGLGYRF